MTEITIPLPADASCAAIAEIIERVCADEGLTQTLKSTLAAYAGCVHWHFKKGKERGTLEITWWERENRLWFKVASGRNGDWIAGTLTRLQQKFTRELTG